MSGSPMRDGVIVVGSVSVDLTAFSERLPRPGETIHGSEFTVLLGGKGSNQAIAAARAGARTHFVGCVGSDMFRPIIVDGLEAAGVDIAHLATVPGSSGIAHIRVDASGQNNIVIVPQANSAVTEEQVDKAVAALADAASVVMAQLEIPVAVAMHAMRAGRAHGLTTILDPAPAADIADDMWPLIDIVTPNEGEAEALSGIAVHDLDSARRAGQWFVDRGVGTAIVTCGGSGTVVVTGAGSRLAPPLPVTAVDTTAAGDAFAGYLAAGYALDMTPPEAIALANAAGALTVTTRGASPSIPARADVKALLGAAVEDRPGR